MRILKGLRIFLSPDDGSGGTLLGGNNQGGGSLLGGNNPQPNNAENPSVNNPAGGGSPTTMPGWVGGLPKEQQQNKELWKHPTSGDMVTEYLRMSDKVSRSIVRPPAEGATPEEVAAYRKEIGIPNGADGYDFASIEGLPDTDEGFRNRLREACFSAELTQNQASKVFGEVNRIVSETVTEIAKSNATAQAETIKLLQKEYGGEYPARVDLAKRALSTFGSPELVAKINSNGLANDFHMIQLLSAVGEKVGGDSLLTAHQGAPVVQNRRFPQSPEMYEN